MFTDIFKQAWEAMLYNRRRTAITTVGMAWGIATVVLLMAYGSGFSNAIATIFAQWGTNTIGFFPGKTSEQAGGDKAGVKVQLTLDDIDRVSIAVPQITHISPAAYLDTNVQNDLHSYTWTVVGSRPSYADIVKLIPDQGRFFTGADDQQRAHV
ncbi:MAG: ABC transporter permease, partial [Terracidiphilus sp.]